MSRAPLPVWPVAAACGLGAALALLVWLEAGLWLLPFGVVLAALPFAWWIRLEQHRQFARMVARQRARDEGIERAWRR